MGILRSCRTRSLAEKAPGPRRSSKLAHQDQAAVAGLPCALEVRSEIREAYLEYTTDFASRSAVALVRDEPTWWCSGAPRCGADSCARDTDALWRGEKFGETGPGYGE